MRGGIRERCKRGFTPLSWRVLPWGQGGKVEWSQMPIYVVPTGPGRGRVLWWLCIEAANLPAPLKLLAGLKPKWLEHVTTRNLVFEGAQSSLHPIVHAQCVHSSSCCLQQSMHACACMPACMLTCRGVAP